MKQRAPETSIIIRAFNEERWLPDVFAALNRQRYRDFEVLLVDSGSVDRTRSIAASNGAKIVRLRSEDFTFGHSLNVGIAEARGSFLAILSAHAIPADETWLERLVQPLRSSNVAMVYGGQRGHELSKFSEARDFERVFPAQSAQRSSEPFANNANSAVKRELWQVHKFDEALPGLEDIEWAKFCTKRGLDVIYVPEATIIHVHMETWPQVRNRYYREGMAARWVGLRLLRHVPTELLREIRWCLSDLRIAASQGRLRDLAREIVRFRYEKTRGTISGITDSRGMDNPIKRNQVYFQHGFPALVVRGPNRVRLEERSIPSLKPGEVLVRVSHVGICATDLEIIEGKLGYYRSGLAHYPIVPGHESSGTIVAVGPRVTDVAEGDRIVMECIQGCGECDSCRRDEAIQCHERREIGVIGTDGACAAYLIGRARYVHRVPDEVTLAEAALTEPLAVVHKGLRRLGSTPDDIGGMRCAVVGAGTIGHLAALVLASRGHHVTAIDSDPSRLNALDGSVETAQSLKELKRFDWIVEATGNQKVLSTLFEQTGPGATLLLLGLPYSQQMFSFESVVAYDRSVIGSVGSTKRDFAAALTLLPGIRTAPFLQSAFPLDEFERALAAARSRSALKVMLVADAAG